MSSPPTYSLISATRYDKLLLNVEWNTAANGGEPSPFLLLSYHLDRLIDAVKKHEWTILQDVLTLEYLSDVCKASVAAAILSHGDVPMKLRILLQHDGTLSATASPAAPLASPDPLLANTSPEAQRTIYIDPGPTAPSLFTSTKTTQRAAYTAARARAGLGPLPTPPDAHRDVLLHTPAPGGLVLETSIRTVAFRRGGRWVTPAAHSGCLPGVMRRLALERGLFVEGDVRVADVVPGETVMTANGVEGCWMGRIALLPAELG